MKIEQYVAQIASFITFVSVFLPWVEVQSWAKIGEATSTYSLGATFGIDTATGIFGLFLTFSGSYLVTIKNKFAFLVGFVNLLNGMATYLLWFFGGSHHEDYFNSTYTQVQSIPQIGCYLFLFSVLLFVIVTFKNFKTTAIEYFYLSLGNATM